MKIKIKHRKLGKEKAWGQAFKEDYLIELDTRLVGKKYLNTLIHEIMHCLNPDFPETKIETQSTTLANLLWSQHFRKIDNTEKQPRNDTVRSSD